MITVIELYIFYITIFTYCHNLGGNFTSIKNRYNFEVFIKL